MDGSEIIKASQTKTALDYYRKLCMGNNRVLQDFVGEFNNETSNSKNVDKYKKLLVEVVKEVNGVQEEIGLDSLATPGGTILSKNVLGEDDKLELISYLIIR